jgi:hypothetical protein
MFSNLSEINMLYEPSLRLFISRFYSRADTDIKKAEPNGLYSMGLAVAR